MVDGRWSVVDGRWSIVDGEWNHKIEKLFTKQHIYNTIDYRLLTIDFFIMGIPAPSTLQAHPAAVGLVPGSASLPYFAALRLNKHLP